MEHGGYENEDWVVHTPVLKSFASDKLTPEQAKATLEYFLLRQVQSLTFSTLTIILKVRVLY